MKLYYDTIDAFSALRLGMLECDTRDMNQQKEYAFLRAYVEARCMRGPQSIQRKAWALRELTGALGDHPLFANGTPKLDDVVEAASKIEDETHIKLQYRPLSSLPMGPKETVRARLLLSFLGPLMLPVKVVHGVFSTGDVRAENESPRIYPNSLDLRDHLHCISCEQEDDLFKLEYTFMQRYPGIKWCQLDRV
jgi:hypothetical protein